MHKKLTTFIFILLLANLALEAQEIRNKNFNFNLISEDFIKKQDNFPIVRENDNYFIIDENEYLIIREKNESDYAIILDESLAKNTLHKTSIKLGPSENFNSSLGIILKANKNFSKALIFEINNEGKYRIKEYHLDKSHLQMNNEKWWENLFNSSGWKVEKFEYNVKGIKDSWYQNHKKGNGFFVLKKKKR